MSYSILGSTGKIAVIDTLTLSSFTFVLPASFGQIRHCASTCEPELEFSVALRKSLLALVLPYWLD